MDKQHQHSLQPLDNDCIQIGNVFRAFRKGRGKSQKMPKEYLVLKAQTEAGRNNSQAEKQHPLTNEPAFRTHVVYI